MEDHHLKLALFSFMFFPFHHCSGGEKYSKLPQSGSGGGGFHQGCRSYPSSETSTICLVHFHTICYATVVNDTRTNHGSDFRYITFGLGKRICSGINFSLASIELPLAQVLFHFDWKLLPNGVKPEHLDMTEKVARNIDLLAIPTPYPYHHE